MGNEIGIVSSLIAAYFEAISALIQDLEELDPVRPNEVQTGIRENGLSCAIISLSVFALEAVVNKVKLSNGETVNWRDEGYIDSVQYTRDVLQDSNPSMIFEELLAIRDAIVHNHLWQAEVTWSEATYTLQFAKEPELIDGFGNTRMKRVRDGKTRKTKHLRLNLYPNRIWRRDAYIVFSNVIEMIRAFEQTDGSPVTLTQLQFRFENRVTSLREISQLIDIPEE